MKKLFLFSLCTYFSAGTMFAQTKSNGSAYNPDGIELVYVAETGSMSGFYIGKYEVTQAEWGTVMGYNPSGQRAPLHPVNNVSWKDIQQFIKKLNANTGKNYRLPTEKEWEYAANGGTDTYEYAGSNNIEEVAWYLNNSGCNVIDDFYCAHSPTYTHKAGTKKPNAAGIFDMSGNVWEWCCDLNENGQTICALRGGSWRTDAEDCRVSVRIDDITADNTYKDTSIGFRLVLYQ